jgi:hypothetical protein
MSSGEDRSAGRAAPYVVKTGQPVTWYLGILVLSLVASAVVAGIFWYDGDLYLFGAIASAVGILWSSICLFLSTRTEWTFAPDGIAVRETGLFTRKQRHIAAADIAAVGVETLRRQSLPNGFSPIEPKVMRDTLAEDAKRRPRQPAESEATYRLALQLRNGEILKIDRVQVREDFTESLRRLAELMPRVTWPAID